MKTLGTITPTREAFLAMAATRRVIPVTVSVLADSLTPIGLYRTLAGGRPGPFLMEAAAAGGAVHFVLGNHETMVLYDDLRYVNPKYLRSAQLLGRSYPQLYGADSVIGQWLRTRPVLLKIGDTLFLHGGISPEAVQLALDPARTNAAYQASLGLPKAEVKADPATAPLYDGKTSPIWYRGYFDGRLDTAGVQAVLDRLQLTRIVVGHTSMPHVSSFHGDRVIAIDSSIKNGENGELLFIEDGKLSRGLLDGSRVPLALGEPGLQD